MKSKGWCGPSHLGNITTAIKRTSELAVICVISSESSSVSKAVEWQEETGERKPLSAQFASLEVPVSSTNTCHFVTTPRRSLIFSLLEEDGMTSFLLWEITREIDMLNLIYEDTCSLGWFGSFSWRCHNTVCCTAIKIMFIAFDCAENLTLWLCLGSTKRRVGRVYPSMTNFCSLAATLRVFGLN